MFHKKLFLINYIAIIVLRIKCQHMHKTNNEITKSSNYRDIFNLNYDRTERNAIQLDKEKLGPGTEAHFDISATKNVTALVGKSAQLNCRIKDLGNKTISWIRHRDLHLLTVGENTYTSDQRFTSVYNKVTGDSILKIKYPQIKDSGIYECQISTTPPMGYTMMLSVVEPITSIVGKSEVFIDLGSTVNLTCIIKHSPDDSISVTWMHNNEEISYDSLRGGISIITEKGDVTTSYLLIQRATTMDSGTYTCLPSNAKSKSIYVHVLSGEHPEAIQANSLANDNFILLEYYNFLIRNSAINLILRILLKFT